MLVSMTGFASLSYVLKLANKRLIPCVLELKSLNSRFFEGTCRLPSLVSSLETDFLNSIKHIMIRGRIFLTITFDERDMAGESIEPSFSVIKGYIDAVQKIKDHHSLEGTISLSDLISLPNVFAVRKETIAEAERTKLVESVEKLAQQLMKERIKEGTILEKDLKKRFELCAKSMKRIAQRARVIVDQQKKCLGKILEAISAGDDSAKQKALEVQALLNKIDINEEVIRFEGHLTLVRDVLKSKELEKGKRLEFILQELLRETNTVAAKCSDKVISNAAVDIKVELEKAREQVQNIL